jgi:hypothetical protein
VQVTGKSLRTQCLTTKKLLGRPLTSGLVTQVDEDVMVSVEDIHKEGLLTAQVQGSGPNFTIPSLLMGSRQNTDNKAR